VILTCELVQDLSPIYVTTKQKADICNSFQVIIVDRHTYTHRQTDTSIKWLLYACVYDNSMTI